MNSKGQIGDRMATFVIIIFMVLFLIPLLFNFVTHILDRYDDELASENAEAGAEVTSILGKFQGMIDGAIIFGFFILIIIMFISAFLIDIHPAFIVIYILSAIVVFVLVPFGFSAVDRLWESSQLVAQQAQLPLLNFLRNSIGPFLVAIYFLTGIILFTKLRGGPGQ